LAVNFDLLAILDIAAKYSLVVAAEYALGTEFPHRRPGGRLRGGARGDRVVEDGAEIVHDEQGAAGRAADARLVCLVTGHP
jgi:hypothetical protein